MNLLGNGSKPPNGTPPGRQYVVGFELPNDFIWLSTIFAASGRMGASSGLKSAIILNPYLEKLRRSSPGTLSESKSGPNSRFISSIGVGSTCQSPERSGLPLAARGTGAVRFGLPSRVRGVPGVG